MINRKQTLERYRAALDKVCAVYNKIYTYESSPLIDNKVHDTMLYQKKGMHEEINEIIQIFEDDMEADTLIDGDKHFEYIDQAVAYAEAVDKVLKACNELDKQQAPFG